MVTLSEDSDSWKASGIKRRDFRSSKEDPEINRHTGNRKKNTKKWCKGKVGKQHIPVHLKVDLWHHVTLCQTCSKQLEYFWLRSFRNWSGGPNACQECNRCLPVS